MPISLSLWAVRARPVHHGGVLRRNSTGRPDVRWRVSWSGDDTSMAGPGGPVPPGHVRADLVDDALFAH